MIWKTRISLSSLNVYSTVQCLLSQLVRHFRKELVPTRSKVFLLIVALKVKGANISMSELFPLELYQFPLYLVSVTDYFGKNNWVASKLETFKDLFRSLKFAT